MNRGGRYTAEEQSPSMKQTQLGCKDGNYDLYRLEVYNSTPVHYGKLGGRVLAVLVSALLTTMGVLPHTGVFFMLWYQELTLVYVLVSGPLHFHHKVFFITPRWWTFPSLLNVGGKCKIIELVPFLLANIFACLEPDLLQSGANSKISRLRNLLGSYFVADRLPYFPQMPTTTFKHEWYLFYPNFFYYLNMAIRKK